MTDRLTVSFVVEVEPEDDRSARSIVMVGLANLFDECDWWPTRVVVEVDHNVEPSVLPPRPKVAL